MLDDHDEPEPPKSSPLKLLLAGLGIVAVLDFFIKHYVHFGIDGTPLFNVWYGLVATGVLIVAARVSSAVLQRPDTFYDD
ncbi:MAG: hypothetical protein ACK4MF_06035 [Hyphomicrobiaceae bacterium]